MADDKEPTEGDSLLRKVQEMIDGHRRTTEEGLHKIQEQLREELAAAKREGSDATAAEIKALREALEDVTSFVSEERTARKEKDRVHESESTIVIPPDDVIVPDVAPEPEPVHSDGPQGKSLFKKLW